MKQELLIAALLIAGSSLAATTIDPANPYAYGANIGWINAEADSANGAEVGQAFCSGYLYGANVGWIHLGDGSPVNGTAYQNNSATDYGINHDGLGGLSGFAYGANIGWINFEPTGNPTVDLGTGQLSGYAWGANVGWINLATLATLTLAAPDSDGDGIADAWEYGHTNTLAALSADPADSDGDGIPDLGEYAADTDPFDAGEFLVITDFQTLETTNHVTWPVKLTRLYTLQHGAALSNGMSWATTSASFIPPSGPEVTETVSGVTDTNRFYRVEAALPLSP
ncbi:hypothetical protein P4C99_20705 [Pontiellaceae bacterium B1224]|nr:hypothetical protein [Pontiellaceae bacterium B1224]